jgi:pantetheine-phosphate adenylyltransferase
MSRRVGVYPGTFDPVTDGHMDIIRRATSICDHLIVGCARNAGKRPLFSLDERAAMVREEIAALGPETAGKIEVVPFEILLTEFARSVKASFVIRGLRAVSDFEYEFQMVGMNAKLCPEIETVFLMASETVHYISSRFVKEIGALGGDITHFVSPRVAARVLERFGARPKG